MADAIELIKQDHRTVEQLFQEYEQTQSPDTLLQICTELQVHTTVEEELLYPILERIDSELCQEAEQEHEEAKELISRIESAGESDGSVTALVQQLKQAVQHHVQEEESEVLPKMQQEAGDEVSGMTDQILQRKQQLLGEIGTSGGGGQRTIDLTKEELYEKAKEAGIEGRSKMDKEELARAVDQRA